MKQFTLVSVLLFFTFQLFSQASQADIQYIEGVHNQLETEKSSYVVETLPAGNSVTGTIKAYIHNGQIRIIETEYFVAMGKTNAAYYYDNQKLVFVLDKKTSFTDDNGNPRPGTMASAAATEELSLYFKNDQLIQYVNPLGQKEHLTNSHINLGNNHLNESGILVTKF